MLLAASIVVANGVVGFATCVGAMDATTAFTCVANAIAVDVSIFDGATR